MTTNKKKKCLMCGQRFVPADGRQKYCCTECREEMNRIKADERYWDNKKDNYRPRKCKVCGEWYVPERKNQSTCSYECNQTKISEDNKKRQAKIRKQEMKKYPKGKCPICGKKFIDNGKRKYCSEECYAEANRRNNYKRYLEKKSVDKANK